MRREVSELHAELVRYNLVAWTAGNVSGRVPGADLFVIKPSGVDYDAIAPDTMILCDLDGAVVEGDLTPVQRHRRARVRLPGDAGRRRGRAHPLARTRRPGRRGQSRSRACSPAMADEFGGEIPVGPFALIGNDDIGKGIVATLSGSRSPAVLMQNHGVFTIGTHARAAVKAAVMCEDVARTVHLEPPARRAGADRAGDVDRLYERYQNVYGQR